MPLATDTNPENPVYGLFYSDDIMLPKSAIYANGGSAVVETDGKKTFGFVQKNAIDALEWAAEIAAMKDSYKKVSYNGGDFANGGAVFYIDAAWIIMDTTLEYSLIRNNVEFSWLRFPYGPAAVYGETISAYTSSSDQVFSIPINADDVEEAAYVLSYWQNSQRGDSKGAMEKAIASEERNRRQNFFNDKSYETYKYLLTNMRMGYPYALEDEVSKINTALANSLKGSKTPMEAMSAIEEVINNALEKN